MKFKFKSEFTIHTAWSIFYDICPTVLAIAYQLHIQYRSLMIGTNHLPTAVLKLTHLQLLVLHQKCLSVQLQQASVSIKLVGKSRSMHLRISKQELML